MAIGKLRPQCCVRDVIYAALRGHRRYTGWTDLRVNHPMPDGLQLALMNGCACK